MKPWTLVYVLLVGWTAGCLKCYSLCAQHLPAAHCKRTCECSDALLSRPLNYFRTEDGTNFLVQPGCHQDCKLTCFSLSQGWTLHQCLVGCECQLTTGELGTGQMQAEVLVVPSLAEVTVAEPLQRVSAKEETLCEERTEAEPSQEEACYRNCQDSCTAQDCVDTCSDHFCGGYRPPQVSTSSLSFWLLTAGFLIGLLWWARWYFPEEKTRRPQAKRVRYSP